MELVYMCWMDVLIGCMHMSAHQLHDSVMLGLVSISMCFTEPPAAH